MESYSLFLNSYIGGSYITSRAGTSDVIYTINWDAVFNLNNHKYQKCRLRHDFYSDSITNGVTPTSGNGVIVLNGINSRSTSITGGMVLGLITVDTATSTNGSTTTSYSALKSTSLQSVTGINIEVPKGMRTFEVQLQNNAYGSTASQGLLASNTVADWGLMLIFEFYDPVPDTYDR